ncbi:hypothetical protein KVR01_007563 [Diaporthe batatas]|uniref:uncharacterized protein n=1 Tax=Diaporthe batatas TaxID=748121 RepID=UPI001D058E3B|nr:uncharacterized protein KVR01_007563 [Diaporthe batatas]KAG8163085.1 hypothetical protein KVR01_007563 [Diaporthe batatas]
MCALAGWGRLTNFAATGPATGPEQPGSQSRMQIAAGRLDHGGRSKRNALGRRTNDAAVETRAAAITRPLDTGLGKWMITAPGHRLCSRSGSGSSSSSSSSSENMLMC